MTSKKSQAIFDGLTYGILSVVLVLCVVGACFAYPNVVATVISALTGGTVAGFILALAMVRVRFKRNYRYWTESPVRVGVWSDDDKKVFVAAEVEVVLEAVIRFWVDVIKDIQKPKLGIDSSVADEVILGDLYMNATRVVVEKSFRGLTIICKPAPWTAWGRKVVGLASTEIVAVKYEPDIEKSALAHELAHVIIGEVLGHWDEQLSHRLMDKHGFNRTMVNKIIGEVAQEWGLPKYMGQPPDYVSEVEKD